MWQHLRGKTAIKSILSARSTSIARVAVLSEILERRGLYSEPPTDEPAGITGGSRIEDLAQAIAHAQLQALLLAQIAENTDS